MYPDLKVCYYSVGKLIHCIDLIIVLSNNKKEAWGKTKPTVACTMKF